MKQMLFNMAAKHICAGGSFVKRVEYQGRLQYIVDFDVIKPLLKYPNRSKRQVHGLETEAAYWSTKEVSPVYVYVRNMKGHLHLAGMDFMEDLYLLLIICGINPEMMQITKRQFLQKFAKDHKLNTNYLIWY